MYAGEAMGLMVGAECDCPGHEGVQLRRVPGPGGAEPGGGPPHQQRGPVHHHVHLRNHRHAQGIPPPPSSFTWLPSRLQIIEVCAKSAAMVCQPLGMLGCIVWPHFCTIRHLVHGLQMLHFRTGTADTVLYLVCGGMICNLIPPAKLWCRV